MCPEGSNVDVTRESPEGKAFGQQQGEVEAVGRSDVTLALKSHSHHIGRHNSCRVFQSSFHFQFFLSYYLILPLYTQNNGGNGTF